MDVRTYAEIAGCWALWAEYVDPGANMPEPEFDCMTTQEKIAAMTEMWGEECYLLTCGACANETMLDLHEYQEANAPHWSLQCPACHMTSGDWAVESGN
jgi:hypothetical protein